MKLITATLLEQWADSKEGQQLLPELLYRLIMASTNNSHKIRFPSGDSTYLPGFDGVLICEDSIYGDIQGASVWEMGCEEHPGYKATRDYNKRKKASLGYNPKSTVFVFVTPRRWVNSEKWTLNKNKEKYWKAVVTITAIELEDWLFRCFPVSLWLAEKMKIPTQGMSSIQWEWNMWSIGEKYTLKPSIVLGGRESEIKSVLANMAIPSITLVQSSSKSESLAFCLASLLTEGNDIINRCLVVKNEDTLNTLIEKYDNLVFITNIENKKHTYAKTKGHSIVYVTCTEDCVNASIILPPINRDKYIESLKESGIPYDEAQEISRKTIRNIPCLKRILKCTLDAPIWTKSENVRELIPVALIEQWYEDSKDIQLLTSLSKEPYESYRMKLQKWLKKEDSPLLFIDGYWRIISPYETLSYIVDDITKEDLSNFSDVFLSLMSDIDPDAIEKYNNTEFKFWHQKQKYSDRIKNGVLDTAIILSMILGNREFQSFTVSSGEKWIDGLCSKVLLTSDLQWWLSFCKQIKGIAEASPSVFLDYIQNDLKKGDSMIKGIFTVKKTNNIFVENSYFTKILFALEMLAWEEKYLLKVCLILLELSKCHNESNYVNRPIEALKNIFCIWNPQTNASQETRIQVLETLGKKDPKVCFELGVLLLSQLDHQFFVSGYSSLRWRLINVEKPHTTYPELYNSIDYFIEYILKNDSPTEENLIKLVDLYGEMFINDQNREKIGNYLLEKGISAGNINVYESVIKELNHHRSFPSAQWALPEQKLCFLETYKNKITPGIQDKYQWMFADYYLDVPEIKTLEIKDYKETEKKKLEIRGNVLAEIVKCKGDDGIYSFSKQVKCPYAVGEAYACIMLGENKMKDILITFQREQIDIDFVRGFFNAYSKNIGIPQFMHELQSQESSLSSLLYLPLISIPIIPETINYIYNCPANIQKQYWENVTCTTAFEKEYLVPTINTFNKYERFDASLQLIEGCLLFDRKIPAPIVCETIKKCLASSKANLLKRHISNILKFLDAQSDIDKDEVISFEFLYNDIIKHEDWFAESLLNKSILTSPETMMDLIKMIYIPETEEKRVRNEKMIDNTDNAVLGAKLSLGILNDYPFCPYIGKDGSIEEDTLRNYITKLIELGKSSDRQRCTYHVIGHLLANCPENDNYPSPGFCAIIEDLDNKDVNNGFWERMHNKRGVTCRPAFSGGCIERQLAEKYAKYAKRARNIAPTVADLFDKLSQDYNRDARWEDTMDRIAETDC